MAPITSDDTMLPEDQEYSIPPPVTPYNIEINDPVNKVMPMKSKFFNFSMASLGLIFCWRNTKMASIVGMHIGRLM